MKKTDIQAAVVSLLLHASLLGGFSMMNIQYEKPEAPIKEVLIDIQMGAQDLANDTQGDGSETLQGDPKQGNDASEPAPTPEETAEPKPEPKPEPQPERREIKPTPRLVEASKPVKAPTVRTRNESRERIETPRTKKITPTTPSRERPATTAPRPTPTRPAPRPTTVTPRPTTVTPRPAPTPRPERPVTTAPRPEVRPNEAGIRTNDRNGDGRPDARTDGSGGNGGTSERPNGGRNDGGGGSGGGVRSGGTSGVVLGLNRRALRKVTPRHSQLVNSIIDVCITVNPAGAVVAKSICKKGNPSLESSSLAAVSGWRFNPLPDGVSGNQSGRIRFRFVVD